MKKLCLILSFLFFLLNTSFAQDATYKIEFISNWSSSTHPTDFPPDDHWSKLVGTTHKDAAIAFELGVIASDGIEQVAESGSNSTIMAEINVLITAGLAYEYIDGPSLGTGPGTITINNVSVDADFPYISLITMIAPSPDWVAMIGNQKLTDNTGNWLDNISVEVYATDAGTDSGATYDSPNSDITPHIAMTSLQNVAPFSNEIIGTFVFSLEQVLSTPEENLNNAFVLYPNPAKGSMTLINNRNISIEKAEIYTSNGKRLRIYNNLDNKQNLVFNSLTRGLYFLKIYTDQGSFTKKLILE